MQSQASLPSDFRLNVNARHPPITLDDLERMVMIDLELGQPDCMKKRLRRALASAFAQGLAQACSLRKLSQNIKQTARQRSRR